MLYYECDGGTSYLCGIDRDCGNGVTGIGCSCGVVLTVILVLYCAVGKTVVLVIYCYGEGIGVAVVLVLLWYWCDYAIGVNVVLLWYW